MIIYKANINHYDINQGMDAKLQECIDIIIGKAEIIQKIENPNWYFTLGHDGQNIINIVMTYLPVDERNYYVIKLCKYGYEINTIKSVQINTHSAEYFWHRWGYIKFYHPLFYAIQRHSKVIDNIPSLGEEAYPYLFEYLKIIQTLIKYGADPNFIENNMSPLHVSIMNNNFDIVELLLKNKADPNLAINHITPMHLFLDRYRSDESNLDDKNKINHLLKIYLKIGGNPWLVDSDGYSIISLSTCDRQFLSILIWQYIKPLYVAFLSEKNNEDCYLATLPWELIWKIIEFVISRPRIDIFSEWRYFPHIGFGRF